MVSPYEPWSVGAPPTLPPPDRSAVFNTSLEENIYKWNRFRQAAVLLILLVNLTGLPSVSVAQDDVPDSVGGYIYWDDGISLTGPAHKFDLKVGCKMHYDIGNINANEELQAAFPDFDGFHDDFRRLSISLLGSGWDLLEFKVDIDFANVKDIKDQWIRFTKGSILPHFTLGYMKEPFSLEMLTSSNYLTFMEDTLATQSFSPFRNFGINAAGLWQEKRMTWATGFFLNTGSFSSVGDSHDQISEANGFDLTGRITGLPVYDDGGRELIHLGLSYLHGFRDDAKDDPSAQARTRPETRLTDVRLVDTSIFRTRGRNLIDLEAAWLNGSLAIQGEYFHNFVDSSTSLDLNGWYVQGSWILTGEHRQYRTKAGVFAGINPEREFRLGKSGWGALELALRFSKVDLNDKFIEGGKECNVTAGLNWYIRRKIRFMVNYVHAEVEDRAEPYIENGRADIIMSRFQINF